MCCECCIYDCGWRAQAAISINSTHSYEINITEGKFKNIGGELAKNAGNTATIADILSEIARDDVDDAYRRQYIRNNLDRTKFLNTGDTFALYVGDGSDVGSDIESDRHLLLGAGSKQDTSATPVTNVVIDGKTYNFAGEDPSGTIAIGNVDTQEFRVITGVAAGRVSDTSTDAVNGSQLYATNSAIAAVVAKMPIVSINVNQLNRLGERINQVDADAKAGTAAAMAVGTLGQAWVAGQGTISVGVSNYAGKTSWAIGGSNMSDKGNWLIKYNASGSANNKFGVGGSVTFTY